MTNLKDLAPETCTLPVLDAEARAVVDKFEELFSEAEPPLAPRAPKPTRDEFAIEFPDDDAPRTLEAAAPPRARGGPRTPALASAENRRFKDTGSDPSRLESFELPRVAAAAGSGAAALSTSSERHRLPGFPASAQGRRKSTAIVASIAVALLIGIGAGYLAGKRSDSPPRVAQAESPSTGPTLRFDYELTHPAKSGKKRVAR